MTKYHTSIMKEFNVDYAGSIFDGKKEYQMVIISQFDKADKEIARKVFYLADPIDFTLPQIRYIFGNYPNAARLYIKDNTLKVCGDLL